MQPRGALDTGPMSLRDREPIMMTMTDIAAATNRLVLLAPRREADTKIRRYRIARVKLEETRPTSRPGERPERFSHLKRSYD